MACFIGFVDLDPYETLRVWYGIRYCWRAVGKANMLCVDTLRQSDHKCRTKSLLLMLLTKQALLVRESDGVIEGREK